MEIQSLKLFAVIETGRPYAQLTVIAVLFNPMRWR